MRAFASLFGPSILCASPWGGVCVCLSYCLHQYLPTPQFTVLSLCRYQHMYACMHICTHTHTHTHTHTPTHIPMCARTRTHTDTHRHTQTHTYTHTQRLGHALRAGGSHLLFSFVPRMPIELWHHALVCSTRKVNDGTYMLTWCAGM
jgi:hypothetical protein